MSIKNKLYDIAIIGAGPAGMTAAIYAGRANKTVALIDKDGFGGQIAKSPKVENIPGFVSISGIDFASNMYDQISNLDTVEHIMGEAVLIQYKRSIFIVSLSDAATINARSVIFATGCEPRKLNLDTQNIYYCVTCDGPFFKDKPVLVVGSGNTGATFALELANYCKHVYICDVTMNLMCEKTLADRIIKNKKITFLPNCTIKQVKNDTDGQLQSVILNTLDEIKLSAIFSAIGMIPQTDIAKDYAATNDRHFITEALIPGIFAAGDCTDSKIKQVTTAVASGTIAALDAIQYINSLNYTE